MAISLAVTNMDVNCCPDTPPESITRILHVICSQCPAPSLQLVVLS